MMSMAVDGIIEGAYLIESLKNGSGVKSVVSVTDESHVVIGCFLVAGRRRVPIA